MGYTSNEYVKSVSDAGVKSIKQTLKNNPLGNFRGSGTSGGAGAPGAQNAPTSDSKATADDFK